MIDESTTRKLRIPIGEALVRSGCIKQDKLIMALSYQKRFGGRLGEICVDLGYITHQQLEKVLASPPQDKQLLGQLLFDSEMITQEQLEHALDVQNRSGGRLGDILLFLQYISQDDLYRVIAIQNEMARFGESSNPLLSVVLPYEMAIRLAVVVLSETENRFLVLTEKKLSPQAENELVIYLKKPVTQVLVSESEMLHFWEWVYPEAQTHESVLGLYEKQPDNSAIVTFSTGQRVFFLVFLAVLILAMAVSWRTSLIVLNVIIQIIYFLMTVLKFYIVITGQRKNVQMHFSSSDIDAINENELPVYTLLIPVYKEKEVVKKLMTNIGNLDYPQHKLDVRILLEEDDQETIQAVLSMKLPKNYKPIIVPKSNPKTKPKACNYGLLTAKGEFVVIYDAEDRPERDQLKKAYLAFRKLPDDYVCIQAKLNYYNSSHNVLTRLFTLEYSMWFELLLVGIMQLDIPIPLGGTSNHFRMSFLKKAGGWDPFNVTEDADLGIRLYKFKYKTVILDSRTWEEANSNVMNWIRQRSRWIKGYMQTWLVHMRRPVKFYKSVGFQGFIGYQAMIFGTPLLPIINPIFWLMIIVWFVTKASWIHDLFPGALYYIATAQFIFGNFAFTYINILGMYQVIRDCSVQEKQPFSYGIIKYAIITPLYWVLMSAAAYKAFSQLIRNPFYWEKTHHGLTGEHTSQATGTG